MKPALSVAEEGGLGSEQDFWTSPPSYPADSLPPPALAESERPTPSLRRRLFAKVLFGSVLSVALVLLGYALSLKLGITSAKVGDHVTSTR